MSGQGVRNGPSSPGAGEEAGAQAEQVWLMDDDIFVTVEKCWPELMRLLEEKYPELVPYRQRFEYATGPYPPAMRLHNAYEILRTFLAIRRNEV